MFRLLALISTALAAPQYYAPYGVYGPQMFRGYPLGYPSYYPGYPLYQPLVQTVPGTAGAGVRTIDSLVNAEAFPAINGNFKTDDTTTPARTVMGTYSFYQNGVLDIVSNQNAKFRAWINSSTDLANQNVKLVLGAACTADAANDKTIATVTAPFFMINGFWVQGVADGYNLDGMNGKTSIKGMYLQVQNAQSEVIGCSENALN